MNPLARMKLLTELANIRKALVEAGTGPAAALKKLKLLARVNAIRKELGAAVATKEVNDERPAQNSEAPNPHENTGEVGSVPLEGGAGEMAAENQVDEIQPDVSAKPSWEMTWKEIQQYGKGYHLWFYPASGDKGTVNVHLPNEKGRYVNFGGDITTPMAAVKYIHRRRIEDAISEGKPVPAAVLADYPDLLFGLQASGKKTRERINFQVHGIVEQIRAGKDLKTLTADEIGLLKQYSGKGGLTDNSQDQYYTPPYVAEATWHVPGSTSLQDIYEVLS